MKDQYGNDVPEDLALLDNPEFLSDSEIDKVLKADWYKINGRLCAPYSQLPDCVETPPDIDRENATAEYVAQSLHRVDDMFYHA